jgi:DNA-directed RNA polymerase II subunit RPB1
MTRSTTAVDMEHFVKRVEFSVLSAKEIRNMAVVNVTECMLYERGLPRMNSVLDQRFGTTDRRYVCGTCRHSLPTCPGHSGKIELAAPIYNPIFLDTVVRVLRTVCFFCSGLLNPQTQPPHTKHKAKRRLAALAAVSRALGKCPHCQGVQPTYNRVGLSIKKEFVKGKKVLSRDDFASDAEFEFALQPFFPSDALSILRNISDESAAKLGFLNSRGEVQRPENLIMEVMLVPSTIMRPSIASSESSRTRGHDDLTLRLQDIVKTNNQLQLEMVGLKRSAQYEKLLDQMHAHLAVYILNDTRFSKNPGGGVRSTSIRSIATRLKGKKGRIRGNLCGKRVDFSSRSVVSPDAALDIDQLGVPRVIAEKQTIPMTVTAQNLGHLRGLISRRKCNFVMLYGGRQSETVNIKFSTDERLAELTQVLKIGDVVERHLETDDVVLFNRQPSLHAYSLMAHRVVVLDDQRTFRLNVQTTTPYNADFDGDEMNMHVLQTVQARAEAQEIMAVSKNIISNQAGRPIISFIQDVLVASWLLSRRDYFFERERAMQIVAGLKSDAWMSFSTVVPAVVHPRRLYTGKQLFSMLLPREFHMLPRANKAAIAPDRLSESNWLLDNVVLVRSGTLICGRLDKALLGSSAGGFVDLVARDFPDNAVEFISDLQRLATGVMQYEGFTCAFKDTVISRQTHDRISSTLDSAFCKAASQNSQESAIVETLSMVVDKGATMAIAELRKRCSSDANGCGPNGPNGLLDMVDSGSKGSNINMSQISGCVGMQMVCGQRIFATGDVRGRTLPCYERGDHSPEAHGFVTNPYYVGIRPAEFYFHLMGGREGLVDTAVKTAQCGYISRRISKMIELAQASHTGSVLLGNGEVLQPQFYGDLFIPSRVESVKAKSLVDPHFWKDHSHKFRDREMLRYAATLSRRIRRAQLKHTNVIEGSVETPINLYRLLCGDATLRTSAGEPIDWLRQFEVDLKHHRGDLSCLKLHIFEQCGDHVDRAIYDRIIRAVHRAQIPAGTMPGVIAAQSLSQPTMQITLNTFHSAGKGCALVTAGVPRLREILDGTVNISTPVMELRLVPPLHQSEEAAQALAKQCISQPVNNIIRAVQIFAAVDDLFEAMGPLGRFYVQSALKSTDAPPNFCGGCLTTSGMNASRLASTAREFFGDHAIIYPTPFDKQIYIMFHRLGTTLKMKHVPLDTSTFIRESLSSFLNRANIGGSALISNAVVEEQAYLDARTCNISKEFIVKTSGCHLQYAAGLSSVSSKHIMSNDIHAMLALLGVEAVQNIIFRECVNVLGDGVSPRHIMLVIDAMTFDGFMNAINRHGMGRTRATPIQRASFEEAMDVIVEACTFNMTNEIKGVTECVIMGTPSNIGSGFCDIIDCRNLTREHHDTMPFVGRKLIPVAARDTTRDAANNRTTIKAPPPQTTASHIPTEQWVASEHFEPYEFPIPTDATQLWIRAHIPQGAPRRLQLNLADKTNQPHDLDANIRAHLSIRDLDGTIQMVLNHKAHNTWGKELTVKKVPDLFTNFEINIRFAPKSVAFHISEDRTRKTFTRRFFYRAETVQTVKARLVLVFPTHDDSGAPMSWIVDDVQHNGQNDSNAATPPGSPMGSPPGSPPGSPRSPRSPMDCEDFSSPLLLPQGSFFADRPRYEPSSPARAKAFKVALKRFALVGPSSPIA